MKMTNALLFVAFLLYGFAIAASDSARKCSSECIQTFESAEEDLRNLLRELKDEFFQIKISNEKSIKRIERKLALMRSATDDAVLECLREKSGTPLIKDTKPKRVAMYELKEMIQKNCTMEPNVSFHHFHAVENEDGAVLYTFVPMPREEYERQGYEPTQQSTYYMRRKMCNWLCPGTHVVNVHHPSEIETLLQIFNEYNVRVPPADPELRQYNIGFWFQPDGASKWDDGTAYSKDVWPGFPESMPELTEYSCVNLDLETGKPVIGDCALLYDVVVCEQRCDDCWWI